MPLREFGGRAAGGALGLQHGNVLTDAAGNITVVFAVPFGAVPDVVAVPLDPANNYTVTIRTVNALGFTAHVRRLTAQTSGASPVNVAPVAPGAVLTWNVTLGIAGTTDINTYPISGSSHTHTTTGDQAAGANVTVMWMAAA